MIETHDRLIAAAVRIGAETLREISVQTGLPLQVASGNLAALTRQGVFHRDQVVRDGRLVYRYRMPTAPDVLCERLARVERMRGWTPAALAAMRGE